MRGVVYSGGDPEGSSVGSFATASGMGPVSSLTPCAQWAGTATGGRTDNVQSQLNDFPSARKGVSRNYLNYAGIRPVGSVSLLVMFDNICIQLVERGGSEP